MVNCDPFGISHVCSYLHCRYVHKKFSQQCKAKVGADFVAKEFQIYDQVITVQLAQRDFRVLESCLLGADSSVLVYDVNVVKFFYSLDNWQGEFLKQVNPPDPKTFLLFILLGNRIDIDGGNSRTVSKKEAKEWCASKGNIPYVRHQMRKIPKTYHTLKFTK